MSLALSVSSRVLTSPSCNPQEVSFLRSVGFFLRSHKSVSPLSPESERPLGRLVSFHVLTNSFLCDL